MNCIIHREAQGRRHLMGSHAARDNFQTLRQQLSMPESGEAVVVGLDYDGVESLTSSFIKHSLIWLIRCGQRSVDAEAYETPGDGSEYKAIPIFPFVANMCPEVREELDVVLGAEGLCCHEASLVHEGEAFTITGTDIVGTLDRTLRDSLRRLAAEGNTTATALHEKYSDGINVTGWNNRLADLHRLRLITRRKVGRQWMYAIPKAEDKEVGCDG